MHEVRTKINSHFLIMHLIARAYTHYNLFILKKESLRNSLIDNLDIFFSFMTRVNDKLFFKEKIINIATTDFDTHKILKI